ncbi:MAG TPA: DUF1990 domain-containing protein [Nocardioidaceae bacterium]|nr:DUF1990 domain-containing protein [Nocardioidaceae bacterium]
MRQVRRVSPAEADRLRDEPFTYPEVGQTTAAYPSGFPAGYRLVQHTEVVGHGAGHFDEASERLMSWQMHVRSGLRVWASSPVVEPQAVMVARLGPGPLSLRIPCRVIYTVAEPGRCGFGYGTLPGHPESGEESFVITMHDGEVRFTVTAFSRAGRLLTRLGGPISWRLQERALHRYAAALR